MSRSISDARRYREPSGTVLLVPLGSRYLLGGFSELKDDGSTACGCWIYSGVFPEPGRNRACDRRITANPVQPEWGFARPHNRRIMYNRASADPEGRPWSDRKRYIWWDEEQRRWVGDDQPDFAASVLGLASGFALRWSILRAGRESAADPEAARKASRRD